MTPTVSCPNVVSCDYWTSEGATTTNWTWLDCYSQSEITETYPAGFLSFCIPVGYEPILNSGSANFPMNDGQCIGESYCLPASPTPTPTRTQTQTPTTTVTPTITKTPTSTSPTPLIITTIVSVSGCSGQTIAVPITVDMSGATSVASLNYAITYDNTVLSGNNTNNSTRISGLTSEFSTMTTNFGVFDGIPQFRAVWLNLTPVSFDGTIFNILFKVLSGGTHTLTFDLTNDNSTYTNENAETISPLKFNNGNITSTC
jgi:hypothetical protein